MYIFLPLRPEECGKVAFQMLGKRLVTKQSGPIGKPCDKVHTNHYLARRKV